MSGKDLGIQHFGISKPLNGRLHIVEKSLYIWICIMLLLLTVLLPAVTDSGFLI